MCSFLPWYLTVVFYRTVVCLALCVFCATVNVLNKCYVRYKSVERYARWYTGDFTSVPNSSKSIMRVDTEWINEYFVYQHRYNTVKNSKEQNCVNCWLKAKKHNCPKRYVNEETNCTKTKHYKRHMHWIYCTPEVFSLSILSNCLRVKSEWWGVGVVICLERGADCLQYRPADATASPNPIISRLI